MNNTVKTMYTTVYHGHIYFNCSMLHSRTIMCSITTIPVSAHPREWGKKKKMKENWSIFFLLKTSESDEFTHQ